MLSQPKAIPSQALPGPRFHSHWQVALSVLQTRNVSLIWPLSFYLQPIQRLKGKSEKAYDMKTANLPALLPSSYRDAPHAIRPAVNLVAHLHPQWVPPVPRQSHSTLAPPLMGNTALMDSTLTLSTQYKMLERNGDTSGPDVVGTRLAVSTEFSLAPPILVTSGLSTNGVVHSTSFPTSSTTQEPRGDM